MTEQTTPQPPSSVCVHGTDFSHPEPAQQCPHCDWCDTCCRVSAWEGETCLGCGRIWGTQTHDNAFTMLRQSVVDHARGIHQAQRNGQPVPGTARTCLHTAAAAVAALAPIPAGITPRLRQAMLEATERAMTAPAMGDDPFAVARVGEDDWAVLRSRIAADADLEIVARVGEDGVAALN